MVKVKQHKRKLTKILDSIEDEETLYKILRQNKLKIYEVSADEYGATWLAKNRKELEKGLQGIGVEFYKAHEVAEIYGGGMQTDMRGLIKTAIEDGSVEWNATYG